MHDTAYASGQAFISTYCTSGMVVLDVGGLNMNGSLRKVVEDKSSKFICLDMHAHPSVDVVVPPGDPFPFADNSLDIIVSTSCFEHDPCFWLTFKEMCRVTKLGGLIYINAPSNGTHHTHPGDNWRFYRDAGQSLAYWSGLPYNNQPINPVKVEELFFIDPSGDQWRDFVCIWKRVSIPETTIVTPNTVLNLVGPCELQLKRYSTRKSTPSE